MLKLYTSTLSANGRKVLAIARYLELDCVVEQVNVYTGEGNSSAYRSLNPWGKIPTLTDGDFILWESNAILIYLSEHHANYLLYFKDAKNRASINKWLFWESAHWQPIVSRVLAPRVAQVLFESDSDRIIDTDWRDTELIDTLEFLESILAVKPFLHGERLTLADFSVAGMTTYFRSCGFPFSGYPAIKSWIERLDGIPAWSSTRDTVWSI